jgi:hypothetical protein
MTFEEFCREMYRKNVDERLAWKQETMTCEEYVDKNKSFLEEKFNIVTASFLLDNS